MADVSSRVQGDPLAGLADEAVEKAAAAMAFLDGFVWDEMTPQYRRAHFEGQARHILAAALAGRTVVDLPEPNGRDLSGWPSWSLTTNSRDVTCAVVDGQAYVSALNPCDEADFAEAYALAVLAAVRETRRLAAESVTQKGDDQ